MGNTKGCHPKDGNLANSSKTDIEAMSAITAHAYQLMLQKFFRLSSLHSKESIAFMGFHSNAEHNERFSRKQKPEKRTELSEEKSLI